jgi:hypothetical protein
MTMKCDLCNNENYNQKIRRFSLGGLFPGGRQINLCTYPGYGPDRIRSCKEKFHSKLDQFIRQQLNEEKACYSSDNETS